MRRSVNQSNHRLGWCADELVDLILQKREAWWPKDIELTITEGADGDWMAVSSNGSAASSWEPELAFSIGRAVGEIRSRNAWNGY